jgi:hypothetical protein
MFLQNTPTPLPVTTKVFYTSSKKTSTNEWFYNCEIVIEIPELN